jgi:hypothetical protein
MEPGRWTKRAARQRDFAGQAGPLFDLSLDILCLKLMRSDAIVEVQ